MQRYRGYFEGAGGMLVVMALGFIVIMSAMYVFRPATRAEVQKYREAAKLERAAIADTLSKVSQDTDSIKGWTRPEEGTE